MYVYSMIYLFIETVAEYDNTSGCDEMLVDKINLFIIWYTDWLLLDRSSDSPLSCLMLMRLLVKYFMDWEWYVVVVSTILIYINWVAWYAQ